MSAYNSIDRSAELMRITAASNVIYLLMKQRRKHKRRRNRIVWVRQWITDRYAHGAYHTLMVQLRNTDVDGFINFARMDPATFDELADLVAPLIQRRNTHYRDAISPAERLAVTLRFLASGECACHWLYVGYVCYFPPGLELLWRSPPPPPTGQCRPTCMDKIWAILRH
jgi:hypothetical protein